MDTALLKKEIQFRGSRRAIKELDLVMGTFIDMYLEQLSAIELEQFKNILLELDLNLLGWITEEDTPPEYITENLMWHKIMAHVKDGKARQSKQQKHA